MSPTSGGTGVRNAPVGFYPDQEKRLVQMYADQDRLDELLTESPVGSSAEGVVRHKTVEWYDPIVVTKPLLVEVDAHSRIDSFVKLEGGRGLRIGKNIHIASFAHLNIGGGSLSIADGAAFASGCKVISGGNTPLGVSMSASADPSEQNLYAKHVTIGKNAAILTNAVLIGACMGEGAVLAAGAVATKDIPAFELWAGVPARFVRFRAGHRFCGEHVFEPASGGSPICKCSRHLAHAVHVRRPS